MRWIGMWPGESANAQPLDPAEPGQLGDAAVELVAAQHAAGDQVPGLSRDALIVIAHRSQAVRHGPVTGDPHRR